ncbi:uncharacterized protein LOC135334732 isoform X2 [Halichondria panicea]|uniref:uncharacterized protein LOC135334732 isoform X2 n=1 Tax=Halichondria panicea TaxID=6063 RepID=UPI00312B8A31
MAVRSSSGRKDAAKGDNFRVAVRVRPLIAREIKSNTGECVLVSPEGNAVTVNKPESRRRQSQIGIDDFGELVRSDTNNTHNFFYDIVFSPNSTQDQIFGVCAMEIVESVLQGYNGSLIASGQTGSGKTFTIEGGHEEMTRGIIPRATELIFKHIENYPSKKDRFLVRTSYMEIYNEKLLDLMAPSRDNLRIREDGVGGVFVENLSEHVVRNTAGIMSLLREGARLRTTATTKMNKESSRSHAVFTIIVEHAEHQADSGGSVVTIGKLRLVDLAGSERLDIDAQSKQQEETKNINVSLHTFGKVVTALTTPGVKYVPYRDSKLTRILQDCLGGNCKTTLIATVTASSSCYTESMNTLKFAKRAKNIKNTALVNKDVSQKALLSAYQKEIHKLKEQLEQRGDGSGRLEIEKLEKEKIEAEKEKEEVLSQLRAHQRRVSEAESDREKLLQKVSHLEEMVLYSGEEVTETSEFKQALQKEHARLKRETESTMEQRLRELEDEKIRLQTEREEIQKQKEYFAKMRTEFQPDGGKDETDGEASTEVPTRPVRRINSATKPITPPSSLSTRPPPSGAHIPPSLLSTVPRRFASADVLSASGSFRAGMPGQGWAHSTRPHLHTPPNQQTIHLDNSSTEALRDYASALAHPTSGIPCQELHSGVRIFTGSECVKWFLKNMVGVTTVQAAQDVGQRLMDLNVFMEIQGRKQFVVSDSVYYQFSAARLTGPPRSAPTLTRPHSMAGGINYPSHPPPSRGSLGSLTGKSSFPQRATLHSTSGLSSQWDSQSTASLATSVASLDIGGDLLEHFGLSEHFPTELHVSALYGDRSRLKVLVKELSVDCLDTAGHTPLMYAAIGKQAKCCLQLIRLGAGVNAANQTGQTALLLATALDYEDIIKLLLKNGALTHFVEESGQTVFHLTAKSSNPKCLEYLCKYSTENHGISDRDHHYRTPLHMAVITDHPGNVQKLLDAKADLGISDVDGRTALHYSVLQRKLSCAHVIVDTVPNDVNLVDTVGWSALHVACNDNNLEFVSLLAASPGCDLNLKDKEGCTPLHIAVKRNCPQAIKILVANGANTSFKDNSGKTALQHSMKKGLTECIQVLSSSVSS